ncbi:ABC transporter permease [Orrella sp. JC864]|uniref:ABC transporter permease n=1 Tax=Orrella sp. JC864 TaxID=3120298 RepID=UPI0012BBFF5A
MAQDRSFPRPGSRSLAIFRRNLLVWRKTAWTTIMGDVLEPMIVLLALGYGLGALVPDIGGVPYILFLSAGSICMGALYGATFEATYSAFSRLQIQRTWDAMLNTPVSLDDVVWAEVLWAGAKALKSGLAILLVVAALDISRAPTLLWVPPVLAVAGFTFAAMGLAVSALARSYDFFMYYFTLFITPTVFLSGVFFPVETLPRALVAVMQALPMAAAIELVRPLVLGGVPEQAGWRLAQLAATGLAALWLTALLMRRRFLK